MKHARNLMTLDPKVCPENETLEELLTLFLSTGYKYIPIVDSHGACVGLMDELGLIRALSDKNTDPDEVKVSHFKQFYIPPSFVDANAGIGDILPEMLKAKTNRVVVVSGSKKPVGILAPSNVLRAIVGMRPQSQDMRKNLEDTTVHAEKNWKGTVTADIFKEAFDGSPYVMIITNKDLEIIDTNNRFELLLGQKTESVKGTNLHSIFPDFTNNKITQALSQARELGRCPTQPTAILLPNKKYKNMDMAISALRDENKQLKYYCCVLREVGSNEVKDSL